MTFTTQNTCFCLWYPHTLIKMKSKQHQIPHSLMSQSFHLGHASCRSLTWNRDHNSLKKYIFFLKSTKLLYFAPDCSNPSALAMELLQSCDIPLIWSFICVQLNCLFIHFYNIFVTIQHKAMLKALLINQYRAQGIISTNIFSKFKGFH